MYKKILKELETFSEPGFAQWLKPFLSISDKSQEIVLGVRTPILRKYAKEISQEVNFDILQKLLESNIHDAKLLAVFILLIKSKKDSKNVCEFYLKNLDYINNWDLIDYSAPHIVAPNVEDKILCQLADSDYLWANRVAMVSTIYFIKQNKFSLAIKFAKKFMNHNHHLMHKAAGWMLREIGKKDEKTLRKFLDMYSDRMPAVMRSYAKERLK